MDRVRGAVCLAMSISASMRGSGVLARNLAPSAQGQRECSRLEVGAGAEVHRRVLHARPGAIRTGEEGGGGAGLGLLELLIEAVPVQGRDDLGGYPLRLLFRCDRPLGFAA